MKKLVLKVSLLSFVGILVLFAIVYGAFSLFAPHLLGSLFEHIGANNQSLYFYEKEYNKNQTTTNLYRVLNKAIIFENNPKIIEYFEKFYSLENYEKNIDTINSANYNADASVLENISLSNADNRLKIRYVKALCTQNRFNDAFDFAKDDLSETEFDYKNINFVFAGMAEYINKDNASLFDSNKIGNISVSDGIYNYYQQIKNLFLNAEANSQDNYTLGGLANKLLIITDFMQILDDFSISENYSVENMLTIQDFANTLKTKLATYVG